LTSDDFPAPEGAETKKRLPEVVGFLLIATHKKWGELLNYLFLNYFLNYSRF